MGQGRPATIELRLQAAGGPLACGCHLATWRGRGVYGRNSDLAVYRDMHYLPNDGAATAGQ
eukprot:2682913-Pyramimonas_sp.AAC.1